MQEVKKIENQVIINDIEIENQILGMVIKNNILLQSIDDVINGDDFYFSFNNLLFVEIVNQLKENKVVNLSSLKHLGIKYNQLDHLKNIICDASSVYSIRELAINLRDIACKRRLFETLQELLYPDNFNNSNIEAIANSINEATNKINTNFSNNELTIDEIRESITNSKKEAGIKTNIKKLDEILKGGFKRTHLNFIGARPRVGKTSFIANYLSNAIKQNQKAVFFSLEVSNLEAYLKTISNFVGWCSDDIEHQFKTNKKTETLEEAHEIIKNNLIIRSKKHNIQQIRSFIAKTVRKQAIDTIVIDYIDLIDHKLNSNTTKAIALKEIATELKRIAIDFNIAVVVLAQINREGDETPSLKNLKDSGGIEEAGDIVLLLHRDKDDNGNLTNDGKIIVAKNRNGNSGAVKYLFNPAISEFQDI